MQRYERRIIRGREVEFRLLTAAEFRRGIVKYQVWAVLPDGMQVLVGEAANQSWAVGFVRMIPRSIGNREIQVVIVESNGLKQDTPREAKHGSNGQRGAYNSSAHLKRHQGGRIDWASYGREE